MRAAHTMRREIAIVVFPGFQLLDAAGPIAVFEMAERFRPDSYAIKVLAPDGGTVRSSSGVCLAAAPLEQGRFDTVIVSGGNLAQVEESQRAAGQIALRGRRPPGRPMRESRAFSPQPRPGAGRS